MISTLQTCVQCNEPKDTTSFRSNRQRCKECENVKTKTWQQRNAEAGLCRCGKDLLPNRTSCVACCERAHVWHRANKERINEHKKRYRDENRDAIRLARQQRWATNENGIREKRAAYCAANIVKKRLQDAAWYARVRATVFAHYGEKCACCGIDDAGFLTIDHVNGGGTKHRKQINKKSIYNWLIQQGFPEGFQTLCFNCNLGKSKCGGICPHERERQANVAMLQLK